MRPSQLFLLCIWLAAAPAGAVTLQEAFEAAPAAGGYDRYLELTTGEVYTGGLLIGPTWDDDRAEFHDLELGLDVKIAGNGAILDLQGQHICISFCSNRLDVEDCIILNGEVRYRGDADLAVDRTPAGSVRYCTFYRPVRYGVRLVGAGEGITVERNIVVDAVDAGLDYMVWTGISSDNLPTGLAVGLSVQTGSYGFPVVQRNWTFFTDPELNAVPLRHYCLLCEYG